MRARIRAPSRHTTTLLPERSESDSGAELSPELPVETALSLESGRDYVGKPKGWGEEQSKAYEEKRYHQPSDELLPWFSYDGTLQQLRVMLRTAVAAANAASQPVWAAGSEFREAGERRRAK